MLIIPKELYVGFQIRKATGNIKSLDGGKNVALGFASYKNEKNEMQHPTLEKWRDKDIPRMCYDNTPTVGISVAGSISRWSTSSKCIRVEDPRGFQLEITVENFIEIIRNCTLDKGVIQDEMVWGWDTFVRLIKVESNNYNIGVENFNIKMTDNISLKDVKPGYIVRLKNGNVGKYLGAWHIIIDDYSNKFVTSILEHNISSFMNTKRCYIIETKDDIVYSSSIIIKKIEEKNEEPLSSIKLYLKEKTKKMAKFAYISRQCSLETQNFAWNDVKRKSVNIEYGLREDGRGFIGEKEIPYSWRKFVFVSDKKLSKNDLKILVKKGIKEFI